MHGGRQTGDDYVAAAPERGPNCETSDLLGQTVSDHAKNGVRNSTVGGRSPKTLYAGIKRTAGSHPKERVLGNLPRALAPIRNSRCPPTESSARPSALSAAYASSGWLPAVRFIPCEAYAADKAWTAHGRLESPNQGDTRLTVSANLSLSDYKPVRCDQI